MMKTIKFFTTDYNVHPIYDQYASSNNGQTIDINKNVVIKTQYHNGYPCLNLKWGPIEKIYDAPQFVYECFYGIIPKNGVIKNITGDKRRYVLHNLKLVMKFEDHKFYEFHPLHDLYSSNVYGDIFDINKKLCIKRKDNNGFFYVNLKWGPIKKKCLVHQFVYECYNGIIPKNAVIYHFDGNKKNNCLHNLQLVYKK